VKVNAKFCHARAAATSGGATRWDIAKSIRLQPVTRDRRIDGGDGPIDTRVLRLRGFVSTPSYASDMSGSEQIHRPALSPSRAADFKQCPLLYRFRAIDRLPEPTSQAQLRGSVVHAALEQLYALPAPERLPDTALSLLDAAWEQVLAADPGLAAGISPEQRGTLLDEAKALLSGYYQLEDPTRFDPQSCEQRVEVELADGTLLRGFIDRIDVASTGELRVVDYKTGKAPPEARALAEFKAMFQMKFYAVALLRSRGILATRLRLIYLADGQILDYSPDRDELLRFEKTLIAIWRAIQSAGATGDFRPSPSKLCNWCAHQAHCPSFGGTPPPYPGWPDTLREGGEDAVLQDRPESAA
jgi:putative RecB family exonuclease